METIRLDKYLADAGAGTRSKAKEMTRKGRVSVNGIPCRDSAAKIHAGSDIVCLDGAPLSYQEFLYYLLYKPAGFVTATHDRRYPAVMELIDSARKETLFPVGRLDLDTEGLLLITNDGVLSHRLLAPGRHVEKTYFAKVRGTVTARDVLRFREGLDIGEKRRTLPASLTILSAGEESDVQIAVCEGKYHQIKRMMHAVGKEVLYLKRISFGTLTLPDDLSKGEARPLSEEELEKLRACAGITCAAKGEEDA